MRTETQKEFFRRDNSIDTKRAMEAGKDARSEALREGSKALFDSLVASVRGALQNQGSHSTQR